MTFKVLVLLDKISEGIKSSPEIWDVKLSNIKLSVGDKDHRGHGTLPRVTRVFDPVEFVNRGLSGQSHANISWQHLVFATNNNLKY